MSDNITVNEWKKEQKFESSWLIDKEDIHLLKGYNWYINSEGYIIRNPKMKNRIYEKIERYLHRIIMNAKKDQLVDHINRNRLDNRKCNLRFVTWSQSCRNKKIVMGKLGIRGVRKVGNKYRAYISENNKQVHLGYFININEAISAFNKRYDSHFV